MKREELLERREEKKEAFNRAKSEYEETSPENKSANLYSQAVSSTGVANYSLLLEEYEEAIKWFRKSAEVYIENFEAIISGNFSEYSTARSLPKKLVRSFKYALLSGEEVLIMRSLEKIKEMPKEIEMKLGDELEEVAVDKNSLNHCKSIYCLEKDTKDKVQKIIEQIEVDYYRINQVKCIEGIAEEDLDRIQSGFLGIINQQKGSIPENHSSPLDGVSDDLISMQALALRHGIKIEADQRYSDQKFLEKLSE